MSIDRVVQEALLHGSVTGTKIGSDSDLAARKKITGRQVKALHFFAFSKQLQIVKV